MSDLMQIRPVGAELFHETEGRTEEYDEADSHSPAILRNYLKISHVPFNA